MLGVESVPAVCRTCVEIIEVERIWEPVRADKARCDFLRSELGIDDGEFLCPVCDAELQELAISDAGGADHVTVSTPCPSCGHELEAEESGLLWD